MKVFLMAFDRPLHPFCEAEKIMRKKMRIQPISCCVISNLETLRNGIQLNKPIELTQWRAVSLTPDGRVLFEFDVPSPTRSSGS